MLIHKIEVNCRSRFPNDLQLEIYRKFKETETAYTLIFLNLFIPATIMMLSGAKVT